MLLAQRQLHIAARGKQRGIAFAEQNHRQTSSQLGRQRICGMAPSLQSWLGFLHHRKNQRQAPLTRTRPARSNGPSHPFSIGTRNGISHDIGGFNRANSSNGEKLWITRAHSDQLQSVRQRIHDQQVNNDSVRWSKRHGRDPPGLER